MLLLEWAGDLRTQAVAKVLPTACIGRLTIGARRGTVAELLTETCQRERRQRFAALTAGTAGAAPDLGELRDRWTSGWSLAVEFGVTTPAIGYAPVDTAGGRDFGQVNLGLLSILFGRVSVLALFAQTARIAIIPRDASAEHRSPSRAQKFWSPS